MKKKPVKKAADRRLSLKIASASCNQTAGDWPRNLGNILHAIDLAAADGADLLALEELGLCGYERGDDFFYTDNETTLALLQDIARHARKTAPGLILAVGHPWRLADKNIPAAAERRKNPIFNRLNNPFNVVSLIADGKIVSMSAKRYLFNYERGYEKRHFEEWSEAAANAYKNSYGRGRHGTIRIRVGRDVIPFGSPVVAIGHGKSFVNAHVAICEEYWIGSRFDGSSGNRDYARDNPIAQKARVFDLGVVINANASPPAAGKIDRHRELCRLASRHCGVIVHTDGLGSSGSTFAQFGSRLMAQDGKIIAEGVRNSFRDVAYTSRIVRLKAARAGREKPHARIDRVFRQDHAPGIQDGPASWEQGPDHEAEEELRNELLWLFDYMRKNRIQGVAQALSGGADSAYNAAKVRLMVELGCRELGVPGFLDAMGHLACRNTVLDIQREKGDGAAIAALMDHMLTCVYMGTDNSSEETLCAARTLVEGGTDENGKAFAGIGGRFYHRNVQRLVEVYAQIFSGCDTSAISDERDLLLRREIADILRIRADETTPDELEHRVKRIRQDFGELTHDILSVANDRHQLPYENIQARLRQVLIMLFANVEGKIAIANPNLDEGRNSYATWGGDLHGGMISGNAHKNKTRQLAHMRFLHDKGLDGLGPLRAFHWVLKNRPSAELQPKNRAGKVTQFDEDQLGRSFEQMDVIAHFMLYDRPAAQNERKNNPAEVFRKCHKHPAFAGDDIETLHDRIRLSYEKWAHAQFKIHGSPIAATYGRNVDHQSSLRTPNISANQYPEQAQMTLYCLSEMAKRDKIPFTRLSGGTGLAALLHRALTDAAFCRKLTSAMSTPGARDGRKTKISALYRQLKSDPDFLL